MGLKIILNERGSVTSDRKARLVLGARGFVLVSSSCVRFG